MDVDARLQLFDLKTTYQFQTSPGVDQYNMPLYNIQTEGRRDHLPLASTPCIRDSCPIAVLVGFRLDSTPREANSFNIGTTILALYGSCNG